MDWSLYKKEKFLKPLCFSNGKNQEDIVKDVLELIKKGNKIIFIHGVCGTGKSAIALNLARKIGKTSIIVPIKNLQAQYKKDYENEKYLLKENGEKLKISIITGRKNHRCKFLEDNKDALPKIRKEVNAKLHDIFSDKRKQIEKTIDNDISADNPNVPCKIEIKEKNLQKIKQYIKQNKDVNIKNFSDIKDVRRVSIAGVCPYWCPVIPSKYELGGKSFINSQKRKYTGLNGIEFTIYNRKPGCEFYKQFNSYIDSDVIIFNSEKYKIESLLNRKPKTEIEIIDECDEFLDKFSNQKNLNIGRLQNSLNMAFGKNPEEEKTIKEIREIIKQIRKEEFELEEIIPLKETGIYDLFNIFLKHSDFLEQSDDESYLFTVEESARMFEDFLEETYVTFTKKEENLIASIVTTNLAKRFKQLVDKNKIIVLMSGTIHSKEVLKQVFGLEKFEIIEAETQDQGKINIIRTGLEMDCKYSNFSSGKYSRKDYLKALDKCIEIGKRPILVHVNSFIDLPSEMEKREFKLNNLISRDKLKEIQKEDNGGKLIEKFKRGETDILFSTRASRGMDFPGEECNTIVFTKYPNPNVKDAFWKILNKTSPNQYWKFYNDKAKRELLQKIYRGLRFKEDKVDLLSPDIRVLDFFNIN